jgi:hypothetical protein
MAPLPALLMKARHDHLRKTVHSDLVGALGHLLAPGVAMAGKLLLHLLSVDVMAAVVAVTKPIWAIKGGQGHRGRMENSYSSLTKISRDLPGLHEISHFLPQGDGLRTIRF